MGRGRESSAAESNELTFCSDNTSLTFNQKKKSPFSCDCKPCSMRSSISSLLHHLTLPTRHPSATSFTWARNDIQASTPATKRSEACMLHAWSPDIATLGAKDTSYRVIGTFDCVVSVRKTPQPQTYRQILAVVKCSYVRKGKGVTFTEPRVWVGTLYYVVFLSSRQQQQLLILQMKKLKLRLLRDTAGRYERQDSRTYLMSKSMMSHCSFCFRSSRCS